MRTQPGADEAFPPEDVGGVHIKYLYHCPRQLWLYARGYRPEQQSDVVSFGEAVDETSYTRRRSVALDAIRIDWVNGRLWVHEVKSSRRPSEAHRAQVRLYCLVLSERGTAVKGGTVHYPLARRTINVAFDDEARARAADDRAHAVAVISAPSSPDRLPRSACRGCSFATYCWS